MVAVVVAFTTFASTLLGEFVALRYRDRLHRILGFTAGVLLAVVAFDLLPEIFALTIATRTRVTMPNAGPGRGFPRLPHRGEVHPHPRSARGRVLSRSPAPGAGVASALALPAHSLFDGVGIGLGFQRSASIGITVALAVIAHDFSDGLTTVALLLVNGNTARRSLWFLLLEASAPIAGAASTLFFQLGDQPLLVYLGFFAGFLLYIGASDILPEAHADHPSRITLLLTVAGTVLIFLVTRVAAP
jgi:ZIP family zinc transporter